MIMQAVNIIGQQINCAKRDGTELTYYHNQEQCIGAISFRCVGVLSLQKDIDDDCL